jgi:two-component system chemotaxis response regulator CheB
VDKELTGLENAYEAVVIGASTGGTEAMWQIFEVLPADFKLPIFAVQHLHPLQDRATIIKFSNNCNILIKEAEEKELVQPGQVYLAPPNYHLLIEDDYTFTLSIDSKLNYARPSIDVLFESAVDVYEKKLIGIILTGANNDGVHGLQLISRRGGLTIVQDPETAEAPAMPLAAIAATEVDYILAPDKIGQLLAKVK